MSSAQRDLLLISEAKEDAKFRKVLAEAMRESTESFSKSMERVSNSMTQLGAGICQSMEMLSRAMCVQQQGPTFYQNMPQHGFPQGSSHFSQVLNDKRSTHDSFC